MHQLPAGRIPSIGAPAVRSLAVGIGTTSVADFFTLIPAAGSVAGRVFSDVASDGIFNAGDAPLEGWQVFADLNANTVFDAGEPNVLSAADGSYLLSGLAYGPVTIRQTMLPGFTATTFPSGRGDSAAERRKSDGHQFWASRPAAIRDQRQRLQRCESQRHS